MATADSDRLVDGVGAAVFCRAYGLCLVYFAHLTVPDQIIGLLDHTVVLFPFSPWHHFALPVVSSVTMEWLRFALLACGIGVFVGIWPRLCSLGAAGLVAYLTQLDRTLYNNHYVLMIELCCLMAVLDERCLHWPWRRSTASPAPVLARWQLRALELLVLTPYFFGALAKLNRSWLLDAQPVRSWADEMLGELDALSHERLGHMADAYRATMQRTEGRDQNMDDELLLRHFAFAISYAGLVLDFGAPIALFAGSLRTRAVASFACLLFNLCNKLWFGLGVFPWLNMVAIVALFMLPRQTLSIARRPPPSGARRAAWARRLVHCLAVPHALIPLRHLVFFQGGRSSLWTDEGHLYAWHMKLVERTGWLVLRVREWPAAQDTLGGGRQWELVPETDTALHPDQAGELAHNPTMLLTYAAFLRDAFALRGVGNVTIHAFGSCVSANGRAAQPLFLPEANLLDHLAPYTSVLNDLTGYSGVGRFLHPWQPRGSAPSCELRTPPPLEIQRQSDEAFRWLYRPAFFSRPRKRDWPFEARARREGGGMSRSRLPWPAPSSCSASDAPTDVTTALRGEGDEAAPEWARACSFVHAAGLQGGVWCPLDAEQAVQ